MITKKLINAFVWHLMQKKEEKCKQNQQIIAKFVYIKKKMKKICLSTTVDVTSR